MEAYSCLEPGGRQWSHMWPLEQDRQPKPAGTLPSSAQLLLALEILHVWLCSPEGGLENTQENGKKCASIMT